MSERTDLENLEVTPEMEIMFALKTARTFLDDCRNSNTPTVIALLEETIKTASEFFEEVKQMREELNGYENPQFK